MTASNSSTHPVTGKPTDYQSRLADHRCIRWTADQLRLMAEMEAADPRCGIGATDTPTRCSTHPKEAANGR